MKLAVGRAFPIAIRVKGFLTARTPLAGIEPTSVISKRWLHKRLANQLHLTDFFTASNVSQNRYDNFRLN